MLKSKRYPRIDQLYSSLGYGTRKDVFYLIKEGRITVDGISKPKADMRVDPKTILIDDKPLDHPEGLLVLLNKPVGYVCSHNAKEGPSVYELLPEQWNYRSPAVESIGRLDKDTSGLLLLTDQHSFIHYLTSPKNHVTKVYEVRVGSDLNEKMISIFSSGTLKLEGEEKACLPAKLEILEPRFAKISINEGRFHQVRRMFEAVQAPVLTLHRTQFGALSLKDIKESSYQTLDPDISSVLGDAV